MSFEASLSSPLSEQAIAAALTPYLAGIPAPGGLYSQLAIYLELLLKWNAHTNLTAIRDPEEIVRRHFGESLFAGRHLPPGTRTLLDFGSGAGFPGIPIALLRRDLSITLAESQNKKATFLHEVVRTLNLTHKVEVWPARVEAMPQARTFECVCLRAVDSITSALRVAAARTSRSLLLLTTTFAPPILPGDFFGESLPLPGSQDGILLIASRAPHL